MRLVKIILPRNNQRDALACETFLSALVQSRDMPIALEIGGTPQERMFLVRGGEAAVALAMSQLALAYPQCDFVGVSPEQDPAQNNAAVCSTMELRLREPAYLPLRTSVSREGRASYDDFSRAADPMLGLLGAMNGLSKGQTCLIQYGLNPMPDDWSKYWRGSLDDVNERSKLQPQHAFAASLNQLGLLFGMLGCGALASAFTFGWQLWAWLIGVGLITLGLFCLWLRTRLPSPPNPLLVQQKINQSAFRVRIRAFVWANTEREAEQHLGRLQAAFKGYNLAGANGFVYMNISHKGTKTQRLEENVLCDFVPERGTFFERLFSPSRHWPILNVSEMAALWHLPHSEAGVQGVAYTASKQVLPLPELVSEGVWIGESRGQGRTLPVRLSRQMLRGNIGLIAKTQSGKSNLMALLIGDVLANDPEAAVIVIDPHRTLAHKVASMIPSNRAADAIYWDLSDRERPFGLNVIDRVSRVSDVSQVSLVPVDKRVSDVIDAFNEIWPQNWGPRMEDYLRGPLLTLAAANDALLNEFAFHEWRLGAQVAFSGWADANRALPLDASALNMLDKCASGFACLQSPVSDSALTLYNPLSKLFAAYARDRNSPVVTAILAPTVFQIANLICRKHPAERKMKRGPGLLARMYPDADGVMHPLQYTLLDVNPLLNIQSVEMRTAATGALNKYQHRHLMNWWRDSFEAYATGNARLLLDMVTPVRTKLNRFSSSDIARRIFGQPQSTIDLAQVIDHGGILVVDLAAGMIGQETAALLGATVVNWLASVVFSRQDDGPRTIDDAQTHHLSSTSRRIFLVIDEFQSLPGADYAFLLSELAKYGVQLCLGTQSLGVLETLSPKTRRAWLDNTSALFVFRSGADDAQTLARELSVAEDDRLTIAPSDIVGLPDYACFARVRGVSHPFRVETRKAEDGDEAALARIWAASRERYGRNAAVVDEWLRSSAECNGESNNNRVTAAKRLIR